MRAIGTSSYGDAASLPPASVSIYKCWRIPPSKLAESTPLNGRSWVKICGSPDVSGLHKLKAWRRWPESDYPFRVNTVQLAVVVESCRNSADGAMLESWLECGESGHIPDVRRRLMTSSYGDAASLPQELNSTSRPSQGNRTPRRRNVTDPPRKTRALVCVRLGAPVGAVCWDTHTTNVTFR